MAKLHKEQIVLADKARPCKTLDLISAALWPSGLQAWELTTCEHLTRHEADYTSRPTIFQADCEAENGQKPLWLSHGQAGWTQKKSTPFLDFWQRLCRHRHCTSKISTTELLAIARFLEELIGLVVIWNRGRDLVRHVSERQVRAEVCNLV